MSEMSQTKIDRRTVLKLVAAGVLPSSDGLIRLASAQDAYSPEFFSRSEFRLVDDLTAVILPADDRSPGARAAKVGRYIDVKSDTRYDRHGSFAAGQNLPQSPARQPRYRRLVAVTADFKFAQFPSPLSPARAHRGPPAITLCRC